MASRALPRAAAALLIPLLVCLPRASWAWDRRPQCVPFARALSSIRLFGDAWRWWSAAAGLYNRGATPQAGGVLSFRSDARMPLGHIAVVTRVIDGREIEVDHANWAPGAVRRQVRVLDVSLNNDWTAVRVELAEGDHFGAVYPTNGFIYGWPINRGPQIIDLAEALRGFQRDSSQPRSWTLPIVVGPTGVSADTVTVDKRLNRAMPVVIYGRNATP
jgi:surface antigen